MHSHLQVGIDISYLDFEFVQDLVSSADSRASEFHMFRFIYKWCQGEISFAENVKMRVLTLEFLVNSMSETLALAPTQKQNASIDLVWTFYIHSYFSMIILIEHSN